MHTSRIRRLSNRLTILAVLGLALCQVPATAQTTFTVDSTGDEGDANLNGMCADSNRECTLRAAIDEANASSSSDILIEFNLSGNPPYTIEAQSDSLRIERDNVVIDGSSQSSANAPEIEIEGNDANHSAFVIEGSGNEIRGLSIIEFGNGGIIIDGNLNSIVDNYIGADTQGNAPGGGGTAVKLLSGSSFNRIGQPGEGNVIVNHFRGIHVGDDDDSGNTGNADQNFIQDNVIGAVSASGPVAGNTQYGIMIQESDENIVGGDRTLDEGNMVVDSGLRGIYAFHSDETQILGNLIGINPSGKAMGNSGAGIRIDDGNLSQIGEAPNAETGNVVADNGGDGIVIDTISGDPADSTGNIVAANQIGKFIFSDGSVIKDSNGGAGISDSGKKTVIGGNGSGDRNSLDGNGIELHGTDASLRRNKLSFTASECIWVTGSQNSIGGDDFLAGNILEGCQGAGITVVGENAVENEIGVNSIRMSTGPGIDLGDDGPDDNDSGDGDTGPNKRQNSPEIIETDYDDSQEELTVTYRVDSDTANSNYDLRIRFYRDHASTETAQGYDFLGSDDYVSSDAGSEVTTTLSVTADHLKEGDLIATATDADGNTSEYSQPARYGGIFHDRFENNP